MAKSSQEYDNFDRTSQFGVSEPLALDEQLQPIRRSSPHCLDIKVLDQIQHLEQLRRGAAERLRAHDQGALERFKGEADHAWNALAVVAERLPLVIAAYYLTVFGSIEERFHFICHPEVRKHMAPSALERGYVKDDQGRVMERAL